ncbi:hypothetical protein TW80_12115 [Loktanella sp. S4079]|nr:hypothetical protein TW80_12115 [Loktanella sp. S4079]
METRIGSLVKNKGAKLFPAQQVVIGIVFTDQETSEFHGETGEAMILAASTLAIITDAIPEFEDERRNYCFINNPRAIAKLDPFFDQTI